MAQTIEKGKGLRREASDCRVALIEVIKRLPIKKFQGKVAGELFEVLNAVDQVLIRVQNEV